MAKIQTGSERIKDNKPKTIVGSLREWVFEKKHRDHYHFVYGAPPAIALRTEKPGATTSTVRGTYSCQTW